MQENEEWKRAQLCPRKAGWDKRELLANGAVEHRAPGMQLAGIPNGQGENYLKTRRSTRQEQNIYNLYATKLATGLWSEEAARSEILREKRKVKRSCNLHFKPQEWFSTPTKLSPFYS